MKSRSFVALVGLATAAVVVPLARGQTSPFTGLDEAVLTAGYPSWMEEGVRLTFRVQASTPTSWGDGLLSATNGLTQVDFVSVAGGKAAVQVNSWMEMPAPPYGGQGGWALQSQVGLVLPAASGQFWVHPGVLALAAQLHATDSIWQVARGSQRAAGKTYSSVTFETTSERTKQTHVFDSESGLLLSLRTAQRSRANASFQPTVTIEFNGIRIRGVPWRQGRPPAWALAAQRFVYSGTAATSYLNGFDDVKEVVVRFDVDASGPNYLAGRLESKYAGIVTDSAVQRVAGTSSTGGLWIPPLELRALAERFKGRPISLDRDGATRAELTMTFSGRARYGRNVVTLMESTGVWSNQWDYEVETGALMHSTMRFEPSAMTVETWLTELD